MERIGRYEIISELGRGAMGVVYKAHDPRIGRDVAIKTIRLADQGAPDEMQALKERLFREAQSAGRLSHPGIVTIYDIDEEGGLAYISMEFVEGRTLEMLMQEGLARDAAFLVRFLEQTAAALDYAHERDIVHRDVKPANMMITPEGGTKVTDFGIARIASSKLTQTGTVMGTPSYMSPEQVRGDTVDGRSDQFSLGVIAYELLTYEKPFTGDNLTAVIFKIVSGDPVPIRDLNDSVPEGLEAAVLRALSKVPEERFESCTEFAEEVAVQCQGWSGSTTAGALEPGRAPISVQRGAQSADLDETAPVTPVGPSVRSREATELEATLAAAASPLPPLASRTTIAHAGDEAVENREEAAGVGAALDRRRRRWWPWLAVPAAVALGLAAGVMVKNPWLLDDPVALINLVAVDLMYGEPGGGPLIAEPSLLFQPPAPVSPTPAPLTDGAPGASDAPRSDAGTEPELPAGSDTEAGEPTTAEPDEAPTLDSPEPQPPAPAPAPPAPSRLAKVDLSSQPSGVRIIVDGKQAWTCNSPCSLDLPRGVHTALASAAGFRSLQKAFEVGSDPLAVRFEMVAVMASAHISSEPREADVLIDGKKVGRTNGEFRLSPGYHLIRVEKAGAGAAEQSVLVESDQINIFRFSLRPGEPIQARLVISTQPAGASILLNGRDRRGVSPGELDVPPGDYSLRLSLNGYRTIERRVTVKPQEGATIQATLERRN